MSRLHLPAGMPLAEANRVLTRHRHRNAIPTGDGQTSISSPWIASVTGGAANTKGSFAAITSAPTMDDVYGLRLACTTTSNGAANSSTLLDVGVDTAGGTSYTVKIPNLGIGYKANFGAALGFFPLWIPRGSTIALRLQGAEASKNVTVAAVPTTRPFGVPRPSDTIITMGADTSTSKGPTVTVASNNTKGSWVEITSATAEPFTGLAVSIQGGADTTITTGFGLVDIGIGSAGNEVVIIPNLALSLSGQEQINHYDHSPFQVAIPAGTRLAARAAIDNTASAIDVILHGIR